MMRHVCSENVDMKFLTYLFGATVKEISSFLVTVIPAKKRPIRSSSMELTAVLESRKLSVT